MSTIFETSLSLPLFCRGKVRDSYDLGDKLLLIATDRISAFDYILPALIPNKGKILTQLSRFWFEFTSLVCPNHLLTTDIDEFPPILHKHKDVLDKRSMLVRKTEVVPVECVVRGYLSGSGWKDYKASGKTSGVKLPPGLKESDRLDEIIFTPATKAEEGHDINISFKEMQKQVGTELAQKIKKISIELYQKASLHAYSKGIIIADTKFEFGLHNGELLLVDEIFTPDSSRYWDSATFEPGRPQPAFDKQFLRDWLETVDWDKSPPGPEIPEHIVVELAARYIEVFRRLTGEEPTL